MRIVAAIPALALLGGSAAGLFISGLWRGPFSAAIIAAILLALVSVAVWARRTARPWLLTAAAASAFFAGGAALAARAWHDATHAPLAAAVDRAGALSIQTPIDGVLRTDAAISPTGVSLAIDVDTLGADRNAQRVDGGVLLTVLGSLAAGRMRDWRAGRRIQVPATLRRASAYRDPDVPDRELVMARQDVALVGTVKSGALVEVLARGSIAAEAAAALRQRVRDTVARTVAPHSARSAAIVSAIVIGDRAGLDPGVQRALQEAGTYHVIAISGGNIAILAGVLLGAFRLAGLLGRFAMIVAAGGLVAYGYLVGGGASVDRATLMAVVYFGTRAWDHRTAPLNGLAVVAALLVASNPLAIVDPAFLLTFGATLAILIVMPVVASWPLPWGVRGAAAMLAASVAAEIALFPVAAVVFSRVTVAGLALNFLAIPLMAVAQLAGMALVPLALVSRHLAEAAGWVAHLGATGLVWSAELVRFVPSATWRVPPPHWSAVGLYYLSLILACVRMRAAGRRIRSAATIVAALAALWIVAAPWTLVTGRGDGRLHVVFIDVGQGDATVIRFPRGATWLVDTGGLSSASTFDVGDRVVAPVLRRMGVRRLDRLVLTHGDPDHVGGAASIVREFRPRETWEGVPVPRYEPLALLAAEVRAMGLGWRAVRRGEQVVVDDVRVVVRHPPEPDWERQRVRNDDSVVLEVIRGGVSVLLTGDIGRAVEPEVVAPVLQPRLCIVKAPHHGSAGSSSDALVDGTHPVVAVFSVGRGNPFGHPAPQVVGRYRQAGAEIFRTDEDGAIFLDTDGREVRIRTFNGRMSRWPRNHEITKK